MFVHFFTRKGVEDGRVFPYRLKNIPEELISFNSVFHVSYCLPIPRLNSHNWHYEKCMLVSKENWYWD